MRGPGGRGALALRYLTGGSALGFWLVAASPAVGQGRGVIDLPRLSEPVRVDGVMSDAAWARIEPLPLTMYRPTYRGTPSERTEIRVAYDDQYLYAGAWMFDSRPDQIRINSLYRDRWSGDDTFALFVDPFNDNETGLWFMTNPAGIRLDQGMTGDARNYNADWNAPWDVATSVTDQGWFAELRIPFAVLGFQARDGKVVMGLSVTRLLARVNERMTWPAIDPRYEFRASSVMQDVSLSEVTPRRPVYLAPYVLTGVDRTTSLPAGGSGWVGDRNFVNEAGADLRYGVSDNFHLDLSVNTDFAQVEADDEQVNLTRFPLFFPEKRQFFQERAGLFEFDFGAGGRLFHSRQIGLAPDRAPVRMLGGARVVARSGEWDIAALDVQTASRDALPGENLGAMRVKRRILNPFSWAGAMVTSRLAEGGGHNLATGLDTYLRIFGEDYLTVRAASTFDDAGSETSLLDQSQVYAQWQRRANRGLFYFAQFHRVGADYRPDLGFLPRQDFTRVSLFGEYHAMPERGRLRNHGPGAIANLFWRNSDGQLETYYLAYWWRYGFRSGASGWIEVIHHLEDEETGFPLGKGVGIEPGEHKFTELWFNYSPPTGPLLRTAVDARVGGFYDGWRAALRLDPSWNISRHLELGGSYEFNRIRFPDRGTGLDTHLARLRVGVAANTRLSATALVQLNDVSERLGVNLRVRYNFREGSDLWLVYDEGFHTDRDGDGTVPRLPLSDARVLRLKLTHTFIP